MHWREVSSALYHWISCLLITGLVLSQLLGAVWDSRTTVERIAVGLSPLLGPYQIVGSNDVPYADRIISCVRRGRNYEPRVVSSLLAAEGVEAILEDDIGAAVTGYRIVQRRAASPTDALDSVAQEVYRSSCALIATTLDNILDGCSALGYSNLARDDLRIVDDWDSDRLLRLPNTLPVLIMPYADNGLTARQAVPTWGGDACVFRLRDAYVSSGGSIVDKVARFDGVNRTVRNDRTIEWLGRPGGIWKNGWYEDTKGVRWYSDIVSSAPGPPFDMMRRIFDMRSGLEFDCSKKGACDDAARVSQWGEKFRNEFRIVNAISVMIANGTQYGFFTFDGDVKFTVVSVFDWETLLSNVSIGIVLIHWISILVVLHISVVQGKTQWFGGGIGCVSNAGSFAMLPLTTLPRLKMTLAAFWTVGCHFEGQQSGLSEAWFAVYPAIAQLVLVYFSLLNLLAKVLRRRMSDVLFAPTVAALCLLHYFRFELAASGWLADIDGRVPTVVFSDEVQQLQLADYFTTDVAWRMNGRVKLLFTVKLGLLGVNLVPLLLARPFPIVKRGSHAGLEGVEKALALRVEHIGGLGFSRTYIVGNIDSLRQERDRIKLSGQSKREIGLNSNGKMGASRKGGQMSAMVTLTQDFSHHNEKRHEKRSRELTISGSAETTVRASTSGSGDLRRVVLMNSYELVRLGYIVYGDKYLITLDDWNMLSSMALFRSFCHFWNHRVVVWMLDDTRGDAEAVGGRTLVDTKPEMWRLDDPRLQSVRWWQVSGCAIQC